MFRDERELEKPAAGCDELLLLLPCPVLLTLPALDDAVAAGDAEVLLLLLALAAALALFSSLMAFCRANINLSNMSADRLPSFKVDLCCSKKT